MTDVLEKQQAAYDVQRIRADFPILGREVHGKPLVYLDNGASAQKPQCVIDAISRTYAEEYANVHRGLHYLSNLATERFEAARETVRAFLNAASTDEIIFTRNATEAINLVAYSFGQAFISEGDEIIVSLLEHHSNIVPWHFHRERKGAVIRWIPVDDDGQLIVEEYEKLFSPRTKIVALTHMSNALGTIPPVKEMIRIAHEHGVPVLIDGSQAAVHMPVNVRELDADFYVFTGHKTYGPSGIGVLYGKYEWLEKLPPFLGGGEMVGEVTPEKIDYAEPPHRFEAGTPPIVQAIGLAEALKYMEGVGREKIAAHEAGLLAYATERLSAIEGLRIIGTAREKGALVSFEMQGVHSHDLSQIIDRYGVAVRAGTHCAQPILQRFGVTSTCRASFAMYNTLDEVDVLAEALEKAKMFFM